MDKTPRFIVKNGPPGFWYVWDTALDSLETTFRTIEQACSWADRLNDDPTVVHFRRVLPDVSDCNVWEPR